MHRASSQYRTRKTRLWLQIRGGRNVLNRLSSTFSKKLYYTARIIERRVDRVLLSDESVISKAQTGAWIRLFVNTT